MKAVLPRISPLLNLFGALAAREWAGWSLLLGVPLLLFAFFRGRGFCWKMCPMGFLAETVGLVNPRGRSFVRRVPRLNKALALVVVVTAACGYPLAIWLDPLCIFNGFFAAWRTPLAVTAGVTGGGFVAVLVLSALAPNVWCHRLCPLGGLQEALMEVGRKILGRGEGEKAPKVMSGVMARRTALAAIPAAVAGIVAGRTVGGNAAKAIRPPGADLTRFNALCARCGNCMAACSYKLIVPDFGETGVDGLFAPVLHLRSRRNDPDFDSYCFHDCVKCTEVCPTGALRPLTLEQKHATPIGIAVIERSKCLAWAQNEYCAVCDEYCPYKAVKIERRGDVAYPVIDVDLCRGCGACEAGCPAEPIAVKVRPLKVEEMRR
jgi:ferredoxin